MRLLLVEDEPSLGRHLERGLKEEAYAVDLVATAAGAREAVQEAPYDLVILDLMLPDGSGLDLLREWRGEGFEAPVLILTARDQLETKLAGFEAGADDYLTKPFEFAELVARVGSLLRRQKAPPMEILELAGLALDRTGHRVSYRERAIALTPKEFALLEYLMLHPGVVMERLTIAEHVWDAGYEARSNVIDVIIGRLRSKLEEAGAPRLLHTVKGRGYVLREEQGQRP